MVIWKYTITLQDVRTENVLEMPQGASILSIGNQYEELAIWALVDPAAPLCNRWFIIVGTGTPCSGLAWQSFLGTVQFDNGKLVLHVFDVRK